MESNGDKDKRMISIVQDKNISSFIDDIESKEDFVNLLKNDFIKIKISGKI